MAFCSKCGTLINDGVQFCPKCGQPTNAASQQQVYQQQQYFAQQQQEEETMKLWQKILYFLVGPAGLLAGLVYTIRKKASMAKSAFIWGAVGTLLWIGLANIGGGSDTDMLQSEVQKMMVEKMKEKGQSLVISDFTLVHQDGNNYTGLAACTLDGEKMDLDVKVVYDGSSCQAEWAPTAEYQQKVIEEGLQELFNY